MTNRANRKVKLLDRHEKLTPEVRNMLQQKRRLLKKDLDLIDGLLRKPVMENKKERSELK